jgi:hypothetical protein
MKPYEFEDEFIKGWGILRENILFIQYLKSKNPGNGNVQDFIKNKINDGFTLKICMPVNEAIDHICLKFGFKKVKDYHPYYDAVCDMWVKYTEERENPLNQTCPFETSPSGKVYCNGEECKAWEPGVPKYSTDPLSPGPMIREGYCRLIARR